MRGECRHGTTRRIALPVKTAVPKTAEWDVSLVARVAVVEPVAKPVVEPVTLVLLTSIVVRMRNAAIRLGLAVRVSPSVLVTEALRGEAEQTVRTIAIAPTARFVVS